MPAASSRCPWSRGAARSPVSTVQERQVESDGSKGVQESSGNPLCRESGDQGLAEMDMDHVTLLQGRGFLRRRQVEEEMAAARL